MNIREALLAAKEKGGVAARGEERIHTVLHRTGAHPDRMYFHEIVRTFGGNMTAPVIGYDSLIADDWVVETNKTEE